MRAAIMASVFWVSFLVASAAVLAGTYLAPPWLRWVVQLPDIVAASF